MSCYIPVSFSKHSGVQKPTPFFRKGKKQEKQEKRKKKVIFNPEVDNCLMICGHVTRLLSLSAVSAASFGPMF